MRYLKNIIYFACTFFLFFFVILAECKAQTTILVLGDSLSAAYQMSPEQGWVALLENKLKTEYPQIKIINSSIVGDTTADGLQRLPTLLTKYHPNIVIIELGGNDGLRGLPILAIKDNLSALIQLSLKAGARVLLLGMQLPPNYGAPYAEQFAGIYSRLGKDTSISVMPFLLKNIALNPQLMLSDHIHPNAQAQPFVLQNIWPYLKPMLPEK